MTKTIAFSTVPLANTDAFVRGYSDTPVANGPPEKQARITVEIPASLHRRFKSQAASEGCKIADLVREWVEGYLAKGHT
jgi:predicted DNA binding CopG/RHH family protein